MVYGLVHPLSSWNPVWTQLHSLLHIARRLRSMEGGLGARLSFLLKGPGWSPGKPRMGCPEDIPEVRSSPLRYRHYSVCTCVCVCVSLSLSACRCLRVSPMTLWCQPGCLHTVWCLVIYAVQLLFEHQLVSHRCPPPPAGAMWQCCCSLLSCCVPSPTLACCWIDGQSAGLWRPTV